MADPTRVHTSSNKLNVVLEGRQLSLEWPKRIRRGDTAIVKLEFLMGPSLDVLQTLPNEDGSIAELYTIYNIIAEAELDLPRVVLRPAGVINQPINQGQDISFLWKVRSDEDGFYSGTVWFLLRLIPQEADGFSAPEESVLPVAALPIEFEVVSFGGISGSTARLAGMVGIFCGLLLAIPFIAKGIEWVWRRSKENKRIR